jgi:hypothetical protein
LEGTLWVLVMGINIGRKVRGVVVCLGLVVLLAGVGGCSGGSGGGGDGTTEKMLDYMHAKYDDRFEFVSPFGGGVAKSTASQIVVRSEKFPDASIHVFHDVKDGEDVFEDNYVQVKYEGETRATLEEILRSAFSGQDLIVEYSVGSGHVSSAFTDETTFEEYAGSREALIGFGASVAVGDSEVDRAAVEAALEQAFVARGMVANGSVSFVTDVSRPLEEFNSLELLDSFVRLDIEMSEPTGFDACVWSYQNEPV